MKIITLLILTVSLHAFAGPKQKRKIASAEFTRTCTVANDVSFYVKFNSAKFPIETGLNLQNVKVVDTEFEGSEFINTLLLDQKTREFKLTVDATHVIQIKTPNKNVIGLTGNYKLVNKDGLFEGIIEANPSWKGEQANAELERILKAHPTLLTEGLSGKCVQN